MSKATKQQDKWQRWLSFSAFTLAGVALEGSLPPDTISPQQAAKARRWRNAP